MHKRFPAQIMVIVLVLMSILSVIALSVTLTSVRDKTEKTQNSQYQTYYAVGENKLLDFQQQIGRTPLAVAIPGNSFTLTGDTGNNITGDCGATTNPKTCTFTGIDNSNYNPDKAELLKTIITTTDSSEITGYPAPKDKDILLDIESIIADSTITLKWSGTDTAWSFTVDKTDFTSEKTIYDNNGIFSSPAVTSYTGTCFSYSVTDVNTIKITLTPSSCSLMFFRLRPLMKTGEETIISMLSLGSNTIPLQRTITSTTTTESNVVSGQDSPTVVLESTYLLTTQPLGLFDYVLRTESNVVKP